MKTIISTVAFVAIMFLFIIPQNGTAQPKGYLGVNSEKVTKKLISKYDLPVEHGAYVTSVVEGSAAEEAGIERKDVIVKIGDETIYDTGDLTDAVRSTKPYTEVKVELFRKGEKKTLTVKMGRLKTYDSFASSFSWIGDVFSHGHHRFQPKGVKAEDLTRQLGEYFGVQDGRGVLITEVHKGGVVDKAGFKAGDVITKVDGRDIDDLSDLLNTIDDRAGKNVSVELMRNGKPTTLSIKLPDEDEEWD